MIRINLSTNKQQFNIANIAGVDLTKIKVKALILVILLLYVPDYAITPLWTKAREDKQAELQILKQRLGKLKGEVNRTKDFEKQIQDLKIQEQALGQKLIAVKEAINIKKNPSALLLYVAKNTPPNLWIKDLVLDKETMTVKGEALDYGSIGTFVQSLRSSVFIKDANIASTVSGVREPDKVRIETFEVRFTIGRFDQ